MSLTEARPPQEGARSAVPDSPAAAPIVVEKYGGSSVGDVDRIRKVAERVARTRRSGRRVAVVVSAMRGGTDRLLELARGLSASPDPRELDLLLSSGERVSTALLAMALRELGEQAVSFTGSEAGIVTDDVHGNATILEVRPFRVLGALSQGRIAVVAGFQGESWKGEVTTLGRGGSDTTAVALAAALGAEHCDVYSDVDGVYSGDPRVVPSAQRLDSLTYEEMQEMAHQGARVLNADAVEFARRRGIAIYARAAFGGADHTVVRCDAEIGDRLDEIRRHRVTGVSGRKDLLVLRYSVPPGGADRSEEVLREIGACDLVSAELGSLGGTRLTAVLATASIARPDALAAAWREKFGPALVVVSEVGAASAVGQGVGARAAALADARRAVEAAGVTVRGAFTSRDSVTCIVPRADVEKAVRGLHDAFLETPQPAGAAS